MKKIIFSFCLMLFLFIQAKAQLFIKSGTTVTIEQAGTICLEDISVENNGTFNATAGTISFKENGGSTDQNITGTGSSTFNNLEVDMQSFDLKLMKNINVNGIITFSSGQFDLNGNDISLGGSASISGETETKTFIGTSGGKISIQTDLNMPSSANPGNLGAEITSSQNLGTTTIERRHDSATGAGGESILRQYNISPTTNTGLDATLRFNYLDSELNGITESELELWRYDGANWSYEGFTSRDGTNNYVELTGIDAFSLWTVTNQANALPAELLNFSATPKNQSVQLNWTTATEANLDYFEVEKAANGIDFHAFDKVFGTGNSSQKTHYETIDNQPFKGINYYRLKMVDWNGRVDYSEIESVDFLTKNTLQLYPNPTNGKLTISNIDLFDTDVQIFDSMGRLVQKSQLSGNELDVSKLPEGVYLIEFKNGNQLFKTKIIKR
jgi:hypothetical protein